MGNIWPSGGLFWILGYIFGYVALLILALALSSALYLVAEYAEEFPTFAGKFVKYSLVVVLSLHLLLWFDGMPWKESLIGIGCNLCYSSMFSTFPFIELFSVRSVASATAFLLSHYIWFHYFLENNIDVVHVVGFFVVMVWLVPGGLFVSLSINDNILPGVTGSKQTHGEKGSKGSNLFKSVFDRVQESAGPWCVSMYNFISSKISQGNNKFTGGGAYGRQKKGEDYDSGSGYSGGYNQYSGGAAGGYGAGQGSTGGGAYPQYGGAYNIPPASSIGHANHQQPQAAAYTSSYYPSNNGQGELKRR